MEDEYPTDTGIEGRQKIIEGMNKIHPGGFFKGLVSSFTGGNAKNAAATSEVPLIP